MVGVIMPIYGSTTTTTTTTTTPPPDPCAGNTCSQGAFIAIEDCPGNPSCYRNVYAGAPSIPGCPCPNQYGPCLYFIDNSPC